MFQNHEVLQLCTEPNLSLNNIELSSRVRLLSGPWSTCFESIPRNTFSLILTSDTVYRVKNFEALHDCFDYLLDNDPESQM